MGHRSLLMAAGVIGAASALTLAPVGFAETDEDTSAGAPAEGSEVTRTVTGHLETGAAHFVYLPVEVPRGVNQIAVFCTYDKPSVPSSTPGNSCDIGIFDERSLNAVTQTVVRAFGLKVTEAALAGQKVRLQRSRYPPSLGAMPGAAGV